MIEAKIINGVMRLNQWITLFFLCMLTEKLYIRTPCHTRQSEVTTVGNKWIWGHRTLVRGIGTLLWQLSSAHKNLLKGNLTLHRASLPPPCSSLTNLLLLQSFCLSPSLSKSSLEKSLEVISLMKVLENTFPLSGLYKWSLTQNLYK